MQVSFHGKSSAMPGYNGDLSSAQADNSPLYHLLLNHFDRLEQVYDERFAKNYGFYRPVISEGVRAYLKCGDLKKGFACVRCPDCHYEFLLAFSCRWSRVPDKNFQLVRYFGWYSNRMLGERAKQEAEKKESENVNNEIEIIDVSKYKPRRIPPPTWRECIKKLYTMHSYSLSLKKYCNLPAGSVTLF